MKFIYNENDPENPTIRYNDIEPCVGQMWIHYKDNTRVIITKMDFEQEHFYILFNDGGFKYLARNWFLYNFIFEKQFKKWQDGVISKEFNEDIRRVLK